MKKAIGALLAVACLGSAGFAGEVEQLRMELEEMKQTIQRQGELIDKLSAKDVDRIHKEEMAKLMEEILADAEMQPALPSWLENLTFFGDFRLRYEHQSRGWRPSGYTSHTAKDRNRLRFRLRFGFKKTWWDGQMEVGARFATGSTSVNDSANQSFDTAFTKKPFWIDRAYAKYRPTWAEGLTIAGGKLANPVRTGTQITWDPDLNPEGLYVDYEMPFFDGVTPWAQVGYWMVDEVVEGEWTPPAVEGTARDVTLWTYSLGAAVDITEDSTLSFGGTYYDFDHMDTVTSGPWGLWTVPPFPGAEFPFSYAEYQVIELTARYKWHMLGLPWQVWGTWLENCTADHDPLRSSGGVPVSYDPKHQGEDQAWGFGMKVGKNKEAGDWSAHYEYRHIGLHSWPTTPFGGLGDSEFGGPGYRGHVLGGAYSIDEFMQVCPTLLIFEPIQSTWWGTAATAAPGQGEDHSVTVQVDFKWNF